MTDKKLVNNACDLLSEHCLMFEDEIEKIRSIFRSLEPPPGSVEVRVAVGMHESDGVRYGISEVEDAETPDALYCVSGFGVTHAAVITAWIPPVARPEVRGRTE